MSSPDQNVLQAKLSDLSASARLKIQKISRLQDGELKDAETALEVDFNKMRGTMRELEFLAEDQEEEEDEAVLGRLQQYKQQYQDLQTNYSNVKMARKVDSQQETRKALLAGGDPTKRQRELQTEAEMVGAAQSTTGSLQRSRQVILEQINSTQTILASMDVDHEQLGKVATEYQGQSAVFGSSKRLLRTLKRHSTWDKLVLYGGAAMFLMVCLYVVQKRSLYFVPTFVKTGLGKLVPTWSRSSGQDLEHLTRPVTAQGDDPGTDGFRQNPSHETLQNFDQAQQLLQRHPAQREPEPAKSPDKGEAMPTSTPPNKDESKAHTSSAGATDPADRQALSAGQQPADSGAPKGNSKDGAEASKEQEADKMFVTEKQMKESGYGDAFAKILESIPDHIKNSGPQEAQLVDSPTQGPASDSASSSESADGTDSSSNEDRAREALAAAAGHLEEQQQHQALSLDAGQAYPEHTAQVSSGEQALPGHAALLSNHSSGASVSAQAQNQTTVDHNETEEATSDPHQLHGALPDNISSSDEGPGLQDSISNAVHEMLTGTPDSSDPSLAKEGDSSMSKSSVAQPLQAERQQTQVIIPDGHDLDQPADELASVDEESGSADSDSDILDQSDTSNLVPLSLTEPRHSVAQAQAASSDSGNPDSDSDTVYQSETQELESLSQSKPRHSLPQAEVASSESGAAKPSMHGKSNTVTQKQMDGSGHGPAFASIMASIPDHIKDHAQQPSETAATAA